MDEVDLFGWSLRDRVPGQSAVERVRALRAAGSPEDQVWPWEGRVQAQRVTARLLAGLDPGGWSVLHDVPGGAGEPHLPHLLVGSRGVFVVVPCGVRATQVTVAGSTVWVDGEVSPEVVAALAEAAAGADWASRVLTTAAGEPVPVTALVVLGEVSQVGVLMPWEPGGVVCGAHLGQWLEGRPVARETGWVARVVMAAVQPDTWTGGVRLPWAVIPEPVAPPPVSAVAALAETPAALGVRRRPRLRHLGVEWAVGAALSVIFAMYVLLGWMAVASARW